MDTKHETLLTDFELGSSALRPEHEAWLVELGKRCMRDEAHAGVMLWGVTAVGYGSQSGSKAANLTLSLARAESALDFYASLMERPHAMKLKFLGLGKDYPVDPRIKENPRDRCVHFAVGQNEMLAPAAPKTVDLDLAEIARTEMQRKHKVKVVVDEASETGVGISKFFAGIGYSTMRLNFIATDSKTHRSFRYTFIGGGFNLGVSANPLPMDIMRTTGKGDPVDIYVHNSLDVERHFLGKATIDVLGEGVFITYRGRTGFHRSVFELKLPAQMQAPSFSVKRFNGTVQAGHTR